MTELTWKEFPGGYYATGQHDTYMITHTATEVRLTRWPVQYQDARAEYALRNALLMPGTGLDYAKGLAASHESGWAAGRNPLAPGWLGTVPAEAVSLPALAWTHPEEFAVPGRRADLIGAVQKAWDEEFRPGPGFDRLFDYRQAVVAVEAVLAQLKPAVAPDVAPVADGPLYDQRLDDGWAVWYDEPAERKGYHTHAHTCGPFFDHRHEDGQAPHDHEPGDKSIPAVCRREFEQGRS